MPNLPISQLPPASSLQGDELFVNVQGGVTKYTRLDDMIGYASSSLVESAYLSIYDTSSQNLAVSGSEQVVTFSSVWAESGVSLEDNRRIKFNKAGTYKFNFVAQVANSDNAVHSTWFWIKYNGSNFPNSTTQITLNPRKNSSTPSAQLMSISIIGVAQNDNDYIELYWTGDSTTQSLRETPATSIVPETPSIIANIERVG